MGLSLYEKFLGDLYGTAIGDAMGMPTTFLSRDEVKKRYGFVSSFLGPPEDSPVHASLKPGSYTDDTELTFVLAEAIIKAKRVDPKAVAEGIVKWADEKRALEGSIIGPSTRRAITLLKKGEPVERSGIFGTTNGCAMKISPVGLFDHAKSFDELFRDVVSACMPTHNTAVAISGAVAVAAAVKLAVSGHDVEEVVEGSLEQAEIAEERLGKSPVSERIKQALKLASASDDELFLDRLYAFLKDPFGALTEDAVPAAISIFARSRGDFRRAVLLACNLGGDSDTIGAMVGAIAGSFAGYSGIPSEWIEEIDRGSKTDIKRLAEELLNVSRV